MSSQSQIITVTIQAAAFSALSTTLAQSIAAWQTQKMNFDFYSFVSFMAIAMILTPLNYLYQRFLEDTFPSKVPGGGGKGNEKGERLSKSNTLAKFCLDQSLGAMANTLGFIVLAGLSKGMRFGEVGVAARKDFLPMLLASWRVWPTVTLLNLIVVPFDYRMIVGNIVGVCWGVYVTLQTM